jgi:beta-aspartyl-peptidase (threonine type)
MRKVNHVKAIIALAVVVSFGAIFPAQAKQKRLNASPDVKKIKAVLDNQLQSWNRHDLEGFMAGYWQSDNLTFYSGGSSVSGWKTTLERYRNRYQSAGNEMGKLDFTDLQIELLGSTSAFVRGHWQLKMAGGEPGGLFTLIFRKMGGNWKIVHDHTSTS